jgi:hypothetical protein
VCSLSLTVSMTAACRGRQRGRVSDVAGGGGQRGKGNSMKLSELPVTSEVRLSG